MSVKLQSLNDIRSFLRKELISIYPEHEISSITNIILKTKLGLDRLLLFANSDHEVNAETADIIIEICRELLTGKPVQYVLGETTFYDCIIKVNQNTLIPRPETEELADLVIKENRKFHGKIIDLGTGSGCIAIAIKKNLPATEVFAIDISEKALDIAAANAVLNNTEISFLKGDILKFDQGLVQNADIIISNPPYVLESEKKLMDRNVLDFEPHDALFVPDINPLIFYEAIIRLSNELLNPGGKIYFEINENMGIRISELMRYAGFPHIEIINDINGKNRIIKGKKNG